MRTRSRALRQRLKAFFDIDAELAARTDRSRYKFGGEFNKKKDDGRTSTEDWQANGKCA